MQLRFISEAYFRDLRFKRTDPVRWSQPLVCRDSEETPSAMRLSQASCEFKSGKRPRSCLNCSARLASSRASSTGMLKRLAAMLACTWRSVFSSMALASTA